ncbi:hypothetical protein Tco_0704508 [Tanacetum coccineum]|uniref:Uncharacterized protein n=1 Tax=Tanacetum coccineum TaxID=301880 RepID=A0ABQ4Y3T1_9ASTR
MLEKGSYVPWASHFLRFLDGKKEKGILLRDSSDNGPYKMKEIPDPTSPTNSPREKEQIVADLTHTEKERLMQGTDLSEQERHSRLMIELDKFSTEAGESHKSIYERFSRLFNNMQ